MNFPIVRRHDRFIIFPESVPGASAGQKSSAIVLPVVILTGIRVIEMYLRIKRWLPFFVWVSLIFGASSIPGVVTESVKLPMDSDKLIHFFEYLVFAVLFYRGLSYDSRKVNWTICFVVILTGGGIAGLDEMYQSYIPGRDSSIFDLIADFTGVVAGSVLAALKHRWTVKRGRTG